MLQDEEIVAWGRLNLHDAMDLDCTTAVMLKILDGKCKMGEVDKRVVTLLYDALRDRTGHLLGDEIHALIAVARQRGDDAFRDAVYEQRLYAETMIGRPAMKAYKARLRDAGLIGAGV